MTSHRLARLLTLAAFPLVANAQREDTVVKVAGNPRYASVASLVEEVSIGVVDGADEYMFGDVSGIAVGNDGAIYVLDRQLRGIRMYDVNGKYVRTIGRQGRGPGEILVGSAIAVHPDGRLLLWDTQNWRVNVYSASGANLTQWPVAAQGAGIVTNGLTVDTAGVVYAERLMRQPVEMEPKAFWYTWLRLRPTDGSVIDTVRAPYRWPPRPLGLKTVAPGGRTVATISMPFLAEPVVRVSPLGYLVTGVGNQYAFELRQPNGPVISIRRNVSPEAVTPAERAAERKRVEEYLRRSDPSWSWGSRDVPSTKPFYMDLLIGLDGRIWVQRDKRTAYTALSGRSGGIGAAAAGAERTEPALTPRGGGDPRPRFPTRFDVFEPNGALIGQVRAPVGVVPMVARGDYVWAHAVDDDGVSSVKRYRVSWR